MTNEIKINKCITYEKIFENLQNEDCDDFVKIFSIIEIDNVKNKSDFKILINHLTNHSTPLREIVAIKLEEISKTQPELFINEHSKKQILNGIIDINPNISRAICSLIESSQEIQKLIENDLIKKIESLIEELKILQREEDSFNIQKNKKSHAKNKKMFALYWLLEGLSLVINSDNEIKVTEIIHFAINSTDYTIREKVAKILNKMNNPPSELLKKAKTDQNFYVKNLVYDKINIED